MRIRTRERIAAAGLALIAALTVVAVAFRLSADPPARQAVTERSVPVRGDALTVTWLGDTMLGDRATPILEEKGYTWPMAAVAPLLDADYVIANVETPITAGAQAANPEKRYIHRMLPPGAQALRETGIDAAGLGNNHVMDRGAEGLSDTLTHARAAGLDVFGAGFTLDEAMRPLLVRTDAGTLGVVAFGEYYGVTSAAKAHRPGIAALDERAVRHGLARARAAGADWVVAYVHWGDNYAPVDDLQRRWAAEFADAGYTAVVGTGSHVAQPVEMVGGMPVVYGLGNFAFTTRGRYAGFGASGYSLLLTTELRRDRPPLFRLRCLHTDNRVVNYQTQPCSPAEAATVLPGLGERLVLERDTAIFDPAAMDPATIDADGQKQAKL